MPALQSRHSAFTLVEMLLVIVVITIVTAITVPTLKNSIRGGRLKDAARTVISSGRYARSMAVLKQQPMQVTLAIGSSVVSVVPVASGTPRLTTDTPADSDNPPSEGDTTSTNAPTGGATGNETLTRKLEKVKIVEVTTEDEGDSTITYGTNGRCTPYTVKLQDDYDSIMIIHVDALATATTEAGN